MRPSSGFRLFIGCIWFGLGSACGDESSSSDPSRDGAASASSPERIETVCRKIFGAVCTKWIECKVMLNGAVVTTITCDEAQDAAVANCASSEAAGIAAATDGEVDACVEGFQTFACTNLCGQVPRDPAACVKLSPSANARSVVCAP